MDFLSQIIASLAITTPELSNTSNASIWQRVVAVFAQLLNTISLNISNSEQVIENSARTLRVAGKQYYIDTALAFQYGDDLMVTDASNYTYGYATIDASKQVVKQVSIYATPNNGVLSMNVCGQDANGNNVAFNTIDPDILPSFVDYMNALSPFGISLNIASPTPAIVDATNLYIRYNNTYSLSQIQSAVQAVLITAQSSLRGGAPIYINDIESAINAVPGVRDAYFAGLTCDGIAPSQGYFIPSQGYYNFSTNLQTLASGVVIFQSVD